MLVAFLVILFPSFEGWCRENRSGEYEDDGDDGNAHSEIKLIEIYRLNNGRSSILGYRECWIMTIYILDAACD